MQPPGLPLSILIFLLSGRMIGQGETQCVSHCKPEQVMPLAGHFIEDIAAGAEHTLALAVTGQVWGWGINTDGQLGLGHTNSPMKEPALLTVLSDMNIKQVRMYTSSSKKYLPFSLCCMNQTKLAIHSDFYPNN